MVSVSNVSAGQAASYYSKDNYYTAAEGQWQGKGAETLGLRGEINHKDFVSVIHGKDPNGAFAIANGGESQDHRAGVDLTFSAPKSVSIVAEVLGDERVREAHQQAVTATLAYVEANYSQCRVTENGQTEKVTTCNLVIAKFEHSTSRELDPQLHTHALVSNMTQRTDGEWRAITNEELFANKMLIGQVYRSELAVNLKEAGFAIQTDSQGSFEILGIEQKLMDHFSQRKEQIENKVNEMKESGQYPNMNDQKLREIAALGSRQVKKDVDIDQVREGWEGRLTEQGYTVEGIQSAIAKNAEIQSQHDFVADKQSSHDVIRQAAAIKNESESAFKKEDILKISGKLSVGEHRVSDLDQAFDDLKMGKNPEIKELANNVFTTKEMLKVERDIVFRVQSGQGKTEAISDKDKVTHGITAYEAEKGFQLTQGQKEAVEHILTSNDRYTGIQGDAGTGKTTMLDSVREQAEQQGFTIRGMAPTGKAAGELEAAAGIKSSTLHSFLAQKDKMQIMTSDEMQAHKAEYDKLAQGLSDKDWNDLKTKTDEQVLKDATGAKTLIVDSKNTTNFNDGRQGIKTETGLMQAVKDRYSDSLKNMGHAVTKQFSDLNVSHEKNRTYDIVTKNAEGKLSSAKQTQHFETNSDGFKKSLTTTTYFRNGDINVSSSQTTGSVTIERNNTFKNPDNCITKGKEVWVCDEASMVGSQKMQELLKTAEKADAKVVMVGDTKQMQSISAGKMFGKLQESGGLKTVRMSETQRQTEAGYKDAVKDMADRRTDKALDKLEKQGRVNEISDKDKRMDAIVKDYTAKGNPKDTIIVTARNDDKNELNKSIRQELKEQGKLSKDEFKFTVRESKNVSAEAKHFAQSYSKNDRVISSKAGIMGRAGSEGKVVKTDTSNHSITVQDKQGKEHTIDLKKQGQDLSIYREKEQSFTAKDKVVFLKNDKSLNVKNGQTGEIKTINKDGKASVKMENGEMKNINVKSQYNYVDHGYAVTTHKSQGQTAQSVIYHADTQKGSSYNEAYVAITRGKEDVKIYTDDKTNLREGMKQEQVKTSTIDHQQNKPMTSKEQVSANRDAIKTEQARTHSITESGTYTTDKDGKAHDAHKSGEGHDKSDGDKGKGNDSKSPGEPMDKSDDKSGGKSDDKSGGKVMER